MLKKRLQQIEARRSELLKELEGDITEERLAEIETEQKKLEDEENQIRKKLDLRGKLEETEQKEGGISDETQQRAQRFMETRALTVASGTIAAPTDTQNEVNGMLESGKGILDLVFVQDCHGMGSNLVPYEKPRLEAGTDEEGKSTEGNFVTDYAAIAPVTVDVYTEISREAKNLTPVRYMQAVQRAALTALRKKVSKLIVCSDSTENTRFFGINTAKACVTVKELEKIDAATLRTIILSYGGDEDVAGAAILMLTKEDLQAFGAVRGTNEKKAVYEIMPDEENPNTGIIKDGGLSCRYSLNSSLKAFGKAAAGEDVMYYGKPKAFELDIFGDYNITVSEDAALKKRMIAVLGEVMVGGNVTVYDGFIKVRKISQGTE